MIAVEKIYRTMRGTGALNIVIGCVAIVCGLSVGILSIISGSILLKRKQKITF